MVGNTKPAKLTCQLNENKLRSNGELQFIYKHACAKIKTT